LYRLNIGNIENISEHAYTMGDDSLMSEKWLSKVTLKFKY